MRISEKKWLSYLDVQASGKINMLDVDKVVKLAKKMNQVELTREDVLYIIKHYGQLRQIYGIGGINIDIKSLK